MTKRLNIEVDLYMFMKIAFYSSPKHILFIFLGLVMLAMGSCSYKGKNQLLKEEKIIAKDSLKTIYISNPTSKYDTYTIRPYDVIFIRNLQNPGLIGGESTIYAANPKEANFSVEQDGMVNLPVIGKIQVAGLTKSDAVAKVKEALKDHVTDAVVNIRILNFKISVLGEVTHPGSYTIKSERITLLEALSLAGDLTIYGKRNNILIIREENGKKISQRVDITKSDFINSSYYYLAQNDVIYIEPNKTKINSSTVGPNIAIGISALSLVVTILALTIN